jgi:hypothetical protein
MSDKKRMYHYTRLATAVEYILPEMRLRLGRYSQTNDPKETMGWDFQYTEFGGGSDRDFWDKVHRKSDLAVLAHEQLRVLCCSTDSDDVTFPEGCGYGLSRMWAQYGGNHTGVCFELEQRALHEAVKNNVRHPERLWNRHVEYTCLATGRSRDAFQLNVDGPNDLIGHLSRWHGELMFTKARDWWGEREYRWVYHADPEESEIFVPIGECLERIIVGQACHPAYIHAIREAWPDGRDYKIHQMKWGIGTWGDPRPVWPRRGGSEGLASEG